MTSKAKMKRWAAVVSYHTEAGPVDVAHEIEELEEIQDLVERGPDWATIIDIRITLARNAYGRRITVEEAGKL